MIPSLVISLVIFAGTATVVLHAFKMVRASRSLAASVIFGVALVVAVVVGIRFGVFGHFQINEQVRMQGAPVPLVVFVLEGQHWTDFVKPPLLGNICMVANAVFPVGLLSVLWIVGAKLVAKSLAPQTS